MKKKIPVKGKVLNPALRVLSEESRNRMLLNTSEKTNLMLSIMSLHDELGFSKEQMDLFLKGYRRQIDCYASGNLPSGLDMQLMIQQDYGIDIDDFLRGVR